MHVRFVAMALLLVALGCNNDAPDAELDSRPFETFPQPVLLCFDLREDRGLTEAGLRLRVTPDLTAGRRDIVLPFAARRVAPNQGVLLASGTYDRFTLLSMSVGGPSLGTSTVPFVPVSQGIDRPRIDGLEPGLYFQERGLERWFVFVDETPALIGRLQKDFPSTAFTTYDAVAVAIPERAEGREVTEGHTVHPQPAARTKNVMLFTQPSVIAARRLAIRYEVPPSPLLAATSDNGFKLVLVLAIPLATLFFLKPEDIERPRLRMVAIWGGLGLEILFVGLVVFAALKRPPSPDNWFDFILSAIAILSEIAVLLVKTKGHRKTKTRRP